MAVPGPWGRTAAWLPPRCRRCPLTAQEKDTFGSPAYSVQVRHGHGTPPTALLGLQPPALSDTLPVSGSFLGGGDESPAPLCSCLVQVERGEAQACVWHVVRAAQYTLTVTVLIRPSARRRYM